MWSVSQGETQLELWDLQVSTGATSGSSDFLEMLGAAAVKQLWIPPALRWEQENHPSQKTLEQHPQNDSLPKKWLLMIPKLLLIRA